MTDSVLPGRVESIRKRSAALALRLAVLSGAGARGLGRAGEVIDQLEVGSRVLVKTLQLMRAIGVRYPLALPGLCDVADRVLSESEALVVSLEVTRACAAKPKGHP